MGSNGPIMFVLFVIIKYCFLLYFSTYFSRHICFTDMFMGHLALNQYIFLAICSHYRIAHNLGIYEELLLSQEIDKCLRSKTCLLIIH